MSLVIQNLNDPASGPCEADMTSSFKNLSLNFPVICYMLISHKSETETIIDCQEVINVCIRVPESLYSVTQRLVCSSDKKLSHYNV